MAAVEGQATQLDFHQAMEDFKTMFPDVDADVIEAVLRANQGAVHETIDQLLTMTTDTEVQDRGGMGQLTPHGGSGGCGASNELPPSYALSATPPPSYHQAVPSPHRSPLRGGMVQSEESLSLRAQKNWNPPMLLPLPTDFLRLTPPPHQGVGVLSPQRLSQRLNENALAREAVGESDAELAQYLKDERIALFLQNDEFINELRTNREFMTALQEDYQSEAADDEEVDGTEVKGQLAHLDDATLRERIATMGKASRKKFAQIAKVFSRRKRSGGRSLLPSTGREQLLISADPLIEDDDDDRQLQQVEGNMAASPRHLR
ncbi:CUE domain-containing protein 1-like isoform X1 [Penaeus chinensis]|uniref:CUE domain-containing protein 1-like isoform X1 n=1 Tax=Penaeus chinensis TaxID=139456 RepID=UPI001FB7715D|nr:CUE domain-containing protein 1-like isoform X1 [Penaeus chinensis]XP_047497271.1 CUE domain-containing protein 1-like isoform X1 [Penaeus chinensis]